jgi:ERCC4-type nuclease
VRVVIDTREQTPWIFPDGVETVRGTLCSGDYSIEGAEEWVAVERKSLDDLVQSISRGRDRFWRELARLSRLRASAVVVENLLSAVMWWRYRSRMRPESVIGSCAAITYDYGIPVVWAGDRQSAAWWAVSFMRLAVRRRDEGIKAAEQGRPEEKGSAPTW